MDILSCDLPAIMACMPHFMASWCQHEIRPPTHEEQRQLLVAYFWYPFPKVGPLPIFRCRCYTGTKQVAITWSVRKRLPQPPCWRSPDFGLTLANSQGFKRNQQRKLKTDALCLWSFPFGASQPILEACRRFALLVRIPRFGLTSRIVFLLMENQKEA